MRVAVVLCTLALVVAACGTRLPEEAFGPQQRIVSQDASQQSGASSTTTTAPTGSSASDSDGSDDTADEVGGRNISTATDPVGDQDPVTGPSPTIGGPNQASDVGITASTIRLGNITAENGVLGDTFAPAVRGLRAWVAHTNANGGIAGRQIELFTCDDREERNRSLECARRLVEQDQVFALVATNSRALGGAAQYLADKRIPVVGFPITNSFYRYPTFYSIYGSKYVRDGENVADDGNLVSRSGAYRWFKQNAGVTEAAVFAYDIAESAQAGTFIAKGLELEGFRVTQYTVSFAAPSFDQAVADMERRKTQIVFDAMDDGANRRLCDTLARRNFELPVKVSTVVVMGDAVGTNYNDTCRNAIHVINSSRPYTDAAPEVAEFRSAYERYQPGLAYHQWALEAWAGANLIANAIASMGPTPTREGVVEFLDEMDLSTADGILVGTAFFPEDQSAPRGEHCFSIARWSDDASGWISASTPFPFCYPDAHLYRTPVSERGD